MENKLKIDSKEKHIIHNRFANSIRCDLMIRTAMDKLYVNDPVMYRILYGYEFIEIMNDCFGNVMLYHRVHTKAPFDQEGVVSLSEFKERSNLYYRIIIDSIEIYCPKFAQLPVVELWVNQIYNLYNNNRSLNLNELFVPNITLSDGQMFCHFSFNDKFSHLEGNDDIKLKIEEIGIPMGVNKTLNTYDTVNGDPKRAVYTAYRFLIDNVQTFLRAGTEIMSHKFKLQRRRGRKISKIEVKINNEYETVEKEIELPIIPHDYDQEITLSKTYSIIQELDEPIETNMPYKMLNDNTSDEKIMMYDALYYWRSEFVAIFTSLVGQSTPESIMSQIVQKIKTWIDQAKYVSQSSFSNKYGFNFNESQVNLSKEDRPKPIDKFTCNSYLNDPTLKIICDQIINQMKRHPQMSKILQMIDYGRFGIRNIDPAYANEVRAKFDLIIPDQTNPKLKKMRQIAPYFILRLTHSYAKKKLITLFNLSNGGHYNAFEPQITESMIDYNVFINDLHDLIDYESIAEKNNDPIFIDWILASIQCFIYPFDTTQQLFDHILQLNRINTKSPKMIDNGRKQSILIGIRESPLPDQEIIDYISSQISEREIHKSLTVRILTLRNNNENNNALILNIKDLDELTDYLKYCKSRRQIIDSSDFRPGLSYDQPEIADNSKTFIFYFMDELEIKDPDVELEFNMDEENHGRTLLYVSINDRIHNYNYSDDKLKSYSPKHPLTTVPEFNQIMAQVQNYLTWNERRVLPCISRNINDDNQIGKIRNSSMPHYYLSVDLNDELTDGGILHLFYILNYDRKIVQYDLTADMYKEVEYFRVNLAMASKSSETNYVYFSNNFKPYSGDEADLFYQYQNMVMRRAYDSWSSGEEDDADPGFDTDDDDDDDDWQIGPDDGDEEHNERIYGDDDTDDEEEGVNYDPPVDIGN